MAESLNRCSEIRTEPKRELAEDDRIQEIGQEAQGSGLMLQKRTSNHTINLGHIDQTPAHQRNSRLRVGEECLIIEHIQILPHLLSGNTRQATELGQKLGR